MNSLARSTFLLALLASHAEAQVIHGTYPGAVGGDEFGRVVRSGEDIDGDGIADILVGAPRSDAGGANAGMVRLLSGATGAVLQEQLGSAAGDSLGQSVAFVGDVDLDGVSDYAAGSTLSGGGTITVPGRVELYSGLTGQLIRSIPSPNLDPDSFGGRIDAIGDVNADGVPDIAVAASGFGAIRGKVHVMSGSTGLEIWSVEGANDDDYLGRAMSRVGDQDGDGVDDLIVSAPREEVAQQFTGVVRILSGRSGDVLNLFQGPYDTSNFGETVRGIGDIDLDGTADWAMGSDSFSGIRSVVVRSGATGAVLFNLQSGLVGDGFGGSISAAGDTNGDGQPDIAVGASGDNSSFILAGAVWVFHGGTGAAIFKLEGAQFRDFLGSSVDLVGDVNGDGLDDLAVGAIQAHNSQTNPGFVQTIGWDNGSTVLDFELEDDFVSVLTNGQAIESGEEFGELLNISGVGAGQYGAAIFDSDPLGPNASGPAGNLLVDQGNLLILQETSAQTGGIFDVPEDAADGGTLQLELRQLSQLLSIDLVDLGPTTPVDDSAVRLTDSMGRFRIYSVPSGWTDDGPQGAAGVGTLSLTTLDPQPGFGAVATATEEAGFNDSAVVRLDVHLGGEGGIDNLVFLPSPTAVPTGLVSIAKVSTDAFEAFGESMSNAGDVNGDGIEDLIVGAYIDGGVWVYSGADGSVLHVRNRGFGFGQSVSGSVDLNGDGFADFIIGDPVDNTAGVNAGQARVYSGQDGLLLATFFGESGGDRFGHSVCGVGDADGDGINDIAIGAPFDEWLGPETGRVYLYSGATGAELWTFDGSSARKRFGWYIRAVGDVDGDGRDDVMVAAQGASNAPVVKPSVHVISGATGQSLLEVIGTSQAQRYGDAIDGAGDLDGDGVPDLLVGIPESSVAGNDAGAVHVISGATGVNIYTLFGADAQDQFGTSVSCAGDVNGDGTPDFLVGAIWAEGEGTGTVTLFSGASGVPIEEYSYDVPDSPFQNELLGLGVQGLGDVNGDGFSDFAVVAERDVVDEETTASLWILSGARPVGVPLCLGMPNSTGERGTLSAFGSDSVEASSLTFTAAGLPLGSTVLLVNSQGFGLIPFPQVNGVSSDGVLCVAGAPIGRHIPGVANAGEFSLTVDLENLPTGGSMASVIGGETRLWQAWYRDNGFPGRSNFTDAIVVEFR